MRSRRHHVTQSPGFTLVELLVALSILSTIALMSWRTLDGMQTVEQVTRERSRELYRLQASIGQWQADLQALQQTQAVSALDFDGRVLRLTRTDVTESPSTGSPGMRVVAWGIHDGHWVRWQSPALSSRAQLLQAWSEAARWGQRPSLTDEALQTRLVKVQEWRLFYYRNNSWSNPLSSAGVGVSEWGLSTELPDGVRLVLTPATNTTGTGELVVDWVKPSVGGGKS